MHPNHSDRSYPRLHCITWTWTWQGRVNPLTSLYSRDLRKEAKGGGFSLTGARALCPYLRSDQMMKYLDSTTFFAADHAKQQKVVFPVKHELTSFLWFTRLTGRRSLVRSCWYWFWCCSGAVNRVVFAILGHWVYKFFRVFLVPWWYWIKVSVLCLFNLDWLLFYWLNVPLVS